MHSLPSPPSPAACLPSVFRLLPASLPPSAHGSLPQPSSPMDQRPLLPYAPLVLPERHTRHLRLPRRALEASLKCLLIKIITDINPFAMFYLTPRPLRARQRRATKDLKGESPVEGQGRRGS